MAIAPFRDHLPYAERVTRGISDIPSCTGTRHSPSEGISAGGGGGHLSYRPSSATKNHELSSLLDMQAALDLRNKLSCWGVTEARGRHLAGGAIPSIKAAKQDSSLPIREAEITGCEESEALGDCVIFEFEVTSVPPCRHLSLYMLLL
jgi:hypothetical protein